MNWIKKIGIAAAITCLIGIPVYASNVTVSDETGTVDENGTASYSASVTNNGSETIKPIVVIVRYEDDKLVAVECNSQEIAAGDTRALSEELAGGMVTDSTKISGFIWDSQSNSIPIALTEIEKKGNSDNSIGSMYIGGVQADVDNINKEITAYIPLYDSYGFAVNMDSLSVEATIGSTGGVISVGDVTLSGDTETKNGTVDFNSVPAIKVTSEEGNTAEYAVKLYRIFEDDFDNDSLFIGASAGIMTASGNLSWIAATEASGLYGSDGTTSFGGKGDFSEAVSLSKNQNWKYGTDEEKANEVAEGIDVGIANISDGVFNTNSLSFQSDKALRLGKRVALRDNGANGDTPAPFLDIKIGGGSETAIYEFDMAFDYSRCTLETGSTKNYCAGSISAGVRILSGSESVGTDVCGTQSNESSDTRAKGWLMEAGTGASLDKWHHVKLEYTQGNCSVYIDNMDAPYKNISITKWPTGLRIFGSTLRACEIYLDNLKIIYDVK